MILGTCWIFFIVKLTGTLKISIFWGNKWKKVIHVHIFRYGVRVIYIYHIYDKLDLKKLEENAKLINNN